MTEYRIREIRIDSGSDGSLLGFCLQNRENGKEIEAIISRRTLDKWLAKIDQIAERTINVPFRD